MYDFATDRYSDGRGGWIRADAVANGGSMTAQEIADRVTTQDLTGRRFQKLEALCLRMKVNLADVIALLPEQARTQAESLKT